MRQRPKHYMSSHLIYRRAKKIFFTYFWLHWVLVAVHELSLAVASGGYSCCGVWALDLGSVVVHRLSCPVAREIFLKQGLNWCPLHCEVES